MTYADSFDDDVDIVALGESDPEWRAALGEALRWLRTERGLTQEELADLVPLDRAYVSHLESGHYSISFDVLIRLAKVYDVSLILIASRIEACYNSRKVREGR